MVERPGRDGVRQGTEVTPPVALPTEMIPAWRHVEEKDFSSPKRKTQSDHEENPG